VKGKKGEGIVGRGVGGKGFVLRVESVSVSG